MKKMLILCCILMAFILAACGNAAEYYDEQTETADPYQTEEEAYEPEETADEPETTTRAVETPIEQVRTLNFIPSIDLDFAAEVFAIAQAIWDEDDSQLMGVPLHAPLLIGDVFTRHVVTNMPDRNGQFIRHGDVYVGIVADDVFIFPTAFTVNGTRWGMARWQDAIELNAIDGGDKTEFIKLLIHEGFHAIQDYTISGQTVRGNNFVHFYEVEVRISAILEIEALFAAMRSDGDERLAHIHNALSLRNARRYGRPPMIALTENQHEIVEGVTEFVDRMLVFGDAALEQLELLWTPDDGPCGYTSGALYAMLLNEMGAEWTENISFSTDLGQLLQDHLGINELTPLEQYILEQYGYSTIASIEHAWLDHRQEITEWSRAAISEPYIVLFGHNISTGNENREAIGLNAGDGTRRLLWYGYFVVEGINYILELRGGVIEQLGLDRIHVGDARDITVDDSQTRATAPTWTLEITDDAYKIEQLDNGLIRIVPRD